MSRVSTGGLVFEIADLIDHPGKEREVSGTADDIRIEMEDVLVESPVGVTARLRWVIEGILTRFHAEARASMRCTRCLLEWDETLAIDGDQLFGVEPDEDGYGLGQGMTIDLSGPVRDELGLTLPTAPRCRGDCRGLCPVCGNDLNRDPCGGHEDDSDSPFAVLKDLFDS